MGRYNHFTIASYAHAQFLTHANEEQLIRQLDYFDKYLGSIDKVYLELHRGEHRTDIKKFRRFKEILASRGIVVSGGLTATTNLEAETKHRIFEVYCFSSQNFRDEFAKVVEETASLFDEFILDDFFFTSCRCESCIQAKGNLSWAQYRLSLMEEIAALVIDTAKEAEERLSPRAF